MAILARRLLGRLVRLQGRAPHGSRGQPSRPASPRAGCHHNTPFSPNLRFEKHHLRLRRRYGEGRRPLPRERRRCDDERLPAPAATANESHRRTPQSCRPSSALGATSAPLTRCRPEPVPLLCSAGTLAIWHPGCVRGRRIVYTRRMGRLFGCLSQMFPPASLLRGTCTCVIHTGHTRVDVRSG